MLAIFDKSVAKSPEGLQTPESNSVSALKDGFLPQHFSSVYPGSVTVNLGPSGALAYSLNQQNFLLPRCCTTPFLLSFLFFIILDSMNKKTLFCCFMLIFSSTFVFVLICVPSFFTPSVLCFFKLLNHVKITDSYCSD